MSSFFYYAAYGVNIWAREMMDKFASEPVAKGYLEGYDLEFRGYPTIKPCLGAKVPVVVYRLSEKFRHKLNYDELVNLIDCVPVT
jgi:hypothetical protein